MGAHNLQTADRRAPFATRGCIELRPERMILYAVASLLWAHSSWSRVLPDSTRCPHSAPSCKGSVVPIQLASQAETFCEMFVSWLRLHFCLVLFFRRENYPPVETSLAVPTLTIRLRRFRISTLTHNTGGCRKLCTSVYASIRLRSSTNEICLSFCQSADAHWVTELHVRNPGKKVKDCGISLGQIT